jgi:5-methylcytosine-specific restriction endonuclease McrA
MTIYVPKIEGRDYPTRKSAQEANSKRYFTGNPCPQGHIADRYTVNGSCVECVFYKRSTPEGRTKGNAWLREARKNPEYLTKEAEQRKIQWANRTPEKVKAYNQKKSDYDKNVRKPMLKAKRKADPEFDEAVRKDNRDQARERRANRTPEEKKKRAKKDAEYRQKNRAKYRYYKAMRRARKYRATPPWLTKEQKKEIRELYQERQRRSEAEGIEYHVDHIIPLVFYANVRGLHLPWNLQLLTEEEHRKKTNKENRQKRKDHKTGEIVAIYVSPKK